MKNITITTALLLSLLTPASAGFSFMGDMISDMREAAQEMKDDTTDVARDMKDEMIEAKSDMTDDMKEMKPNNILSSDDENETKENNTTNTQKGDSNKK
jgi:hypothetical protein